VIEFATYAQKVEIEGKLNKIRNYFIKNVKNQEVEFVVVKFQPSRAGDLLKNGRYWIYLLMRFLYVSVYYYFLPFSVIIYNYMKVFNTKSRIVYVPRINGEFEEIIVTATTGDL